MSWKAEYAVLIMISTLIDYLTGLKMSKLKEKRSRKKYLILSICTNLGLLFAFKYFNFVNDSLRLFLNQFSLSFDLPYLNVLLPVGISFYTFQTLSYSIEVYRGNIKPEKHLGIFAVYVAFFPQLVAGPIERAKNLLPQFLKKQYFNYKRITDGLKIMLWGFFLKMVIADRLAIGVNHVYNNIQTFAGFPLISATYLFAFQIYCDFAGYSFIAIGAAQVIGIRLMDNFRRPYFSKSISEFWRRWHISLSTWFRDYLYIPLGGNQVKKYRHFFNLFIVFLICGFWHGAGWNFIIWGGIHGFYLVLSVITRNIREKITKFLGINKHPKISTLIKVFITFNLVSFGWIFFRANSLNDAFYIITHLFQLQIPSRAEIYIGLGAFGLAIALGSILFMEFIHLLQERIRMREFLDNKPLLMRWTIYIIITLAILLFGVYKGTEFIYFQF